jgi:hypothetical protein
MIAHVDFKGPPDVWQRFCNRVVELYGQIGKLQSIYLQKLELEFEAAEEKPSIANAGVINKVNSPPLYTEQIKQFQAEFGKS